MAVLEGGSQNELDQRRSADLGPAVFSAGF